MIAPPTVAAEKLEGGAEVSGDVNVASKDSKETFDADCLIFGLEGDGEAIVKGEVATLRCTFFDVNDPPKKRVTFGKISCFLVINGDLYTNNTGIFKVYPDGHATFECKNLQLEDQD
jgi:hypothetical protein